MRYILLLPLLISAAHAQFVSYPSSSSSSSVVTNQIFQRITNSTFSTGTNGWEFDGGSSAKFTWTGSSAHLEDCPTEMLVRHQIHPPEMFTNIETGVVTFSYMFTNSTELSVVAKIINNDLASDPIGGAKLLTNFGDSAYHVVSQVVTTEPSDHSIDLRFNRSNLWIYLSQEATTSKWDIYLDDITVTAFTANVSITTNSGSGSGGSFISIGGSKVGVTHR